MTVRKAAGKQEGKPPPGDYRPTAEARNWTSLYLIIRPSEPGKTYVRVLQIGGYDLPNT
jgi:hypothetical protein